MLLRYAIASTLVLALVQGTRSWAQEAPSHDQAMKQMVQQGLAYLRDKGQSEAGTLSPRIGSGVTSLAITAAIRHGCPLDDPLIARGLKAMEGFVKPDGGIYGSDRLRNYETCVAIVCLSEANKLAGDGRYDAILKNAEQFVRGLQIGAGSDVKQSDPLYGGVGYGGPERPDLSNTTYLLEALQALETPAEDPAIQRALMFVSRCQNLKGYGNDTRFADLVNDGGFYYVVPTESVDPSTSDRYDANGGLRSYGSMTYSGFKSLIYAGLTKEDPRAKAALEWIRQHYSLEKNPGQGTAGLYYYYNTFGSALGVSGLTTVDTADQGDRNWREDLIAELRQSQQADGSWKNDNQRWMENDPNLCTAFALLALSYCDNAAGGQK